MRVRYTGSLLYLKIFQQHFAVVKSQEDEKHELLSKATGCLQNSTADNIEVRKLKTGKIFKSSKESYVNFKSYTCLMNSFKFFSQNSKNVPFFISNSLLKHINMEIVTHLQLAKIWNNEVVSDLYFCKI